MELLVLNTNLETIDTIDTFESLIWTERYASPGDFELYNGIDTKMLEAIKKDYYLWLRESTQTMIIESIRIESNSEEGNHISVTGRSLESILDRRVIYDQVQLNGNFQNGIHKLLDKNIIIPDNDKRRIDNFVFEDSDDPLVTALTIDTQFTGDNLLEVIQKLCQEKQIGFRVTLSDANQFVFKLYAGTDRSYAQIKNPYIIFSTKFENIINTNYYESNSTLKTITLVAGEVPDGSEYGGYVRRTVEVESESGGGRGLSRRELYTDARDIQSEVDGGQISDSEYNALLVQRGKEKLLENSSIKTFEGKTDTSEMFVYGKDFFMGDIVQIVNEYGIEGTARVTEMIRSQNRDGFEAYPTFVAINDAKGGE